MNRRALLSLPFLAPLVRDFGESEPDGYCARGFRCESRNVWREGEMEYGRITEVNGRCQCWIPEPDRANPGRLILPLNYYRFQWPRWLE